MKRITEILKNTLGAIMNTATSTDNSSNIDNDKCIDDNKLEKNIEVIFDNDNDINIISIDDIDASYNTLNKKSSIYINSPRPPPLPSMQELSNSPIKNINKVTIPCDNISNISLELYKNSKDDYVISLDVSYILESIIDDIVTSYHNLNTDVFNSDICEYYTQQLDYESALESILSPVDIESVRRNVEGIIYKERDFLFNLRSIKIYSNDSIVGGIRCGVFKTSDLIIKIDTSPEAFKCELFAMHFIGKGIIKPHNIVLPYIVKIQQYKRGHHMNFSIQPRINDSLTIYDWMKIHTNKKLPINSYITICISVCKSILFLHSKHVVHGDIKPGNILIQNTTNIPFIIDFGLSGIHAVSEGTGGTKPFCNPSTLNINNDEDTSYEWTKNYKYNDLWSIAFLFSTILIFRNCYNLYNDYPRDFFDSDKYVNPIYLHHIPYPFRDAFQLIIINPKHRVNINKINIRNFIDLLEDGLHTNLTPFAQ